MTYEVVNSPIYHVPSPSFSQGVLTPSGGRLLFVSGVTARMADGSIAGPGDVSAQSHQVFRNLAAVLAAAGATLQDVVKTTTFVLDARDMPTVGAIRRLHLGDPPPASSTVEVSRLFDEQQLIEVEAIAVLGAGGASLPDLGSDPRRRAALLTAFTARGFNFDFRGPNDVVRGIAPAGRVGILEIIGDPVTEVCLLVTAAEQGRLTAWSSLCIVELAQAISVDFAGRLRDVIGSRSFDVHWQVTEFIGSTAALFVEHVPPDTLIITVRLSDRYIK